MQELRRVNYEEARLLAVEGCVHCREALRQSEEEDRSLYYWRGHVLSEEDVSRQLPVLQRVVDASWQ